MPVPFLPYQRDPIAGSMTTPNSWYEFFRSMRDFLASSGLDTGVIDGILLRLDELEENQIGQFVISGLNSVTVTGTPAGGFVSIQLENDEDTPGNTYYYGTDGTGEKGWFTVASAVAGADSVVQTVGLDGVSTFNLDGDELSPGLGETYSTNLSTGAKGWNRPALFESTGVLMGGALSINGGDNTKFDVALTVVGQTDYSSFPANPVRALAVFGPQLANSVPSLAVIATYVGIQMPGATLTMQSSPFTPAQTRTIAPLGAVISNGTNLIAVNNLPGIIRAGINQLQDLMTAIGPMNLSGNVISPNGAGLDLNKSAGVIFKQGSNFVNDPNNPHGLTLAALTGFSFNYRLSTGTQFATTTVVDPNSYESPLGTLTGVPGANNFTIQRFNVFTSNLIRAQYGQFQYNTMAEAEAALSSESFVTEANIAENGILLGFLIVQDGTTDLTNTADAKFIPASKFGGPVGTGGTSITNTDALPEGLVNLYFTDARAGAAVITASITNGDTTHSPSGDAVFDALALKAAIPKGYIDGLSMQWVSGTALTVSSGSAYIEASANIVSAPSDIAKSSLSLSASTWYHVYLYLNAGTPDIEIVTTAPVVYSGTARSKTGDTTRRYVGSVKTDGSSNLFAFVHTNDIQLWRSDITASPFRILSNGVATAVTAVDASAVVPVTGRVAKVFVYNLSTNADLLTGMQGDSGRIFQLSAGRFFVFDHVLSTAQQLQYNFNIAPSPLGAFIDVSGFTFER